MSLDFSNAEEMNKLIPSGATVTLELEIRKGGYDNDEYGLFEGGWGTLSRSSNAFWLDAAATVMHGKYKSMKIFFKIGLYSPNGEKWGQMGASLIRRMLESATGTHPEDKSALAKRKRSIEGYHALDNMVFYAVVGQQDAYQDDPDRGKINTIKTVLVVGDSGYPTHRATPVENYPAPAVLSNATANAPAVTDDLEDDDIPF